MRRQSLRFSSMFSISFGAACRRCVDTESGPCDLISVQCRVLGVSDSGYGQYLVPQKQAAG